MGKQMLTKVRLTRISGLLNVVPNNFVNLYIVSLCLKQTM